MVKAVTPLPRGGGGGPGGGGGEAPSSPISKQKTKLLLKMANAVEDSSARRRLEQRQQQRGGGGGGNTTIDGESINRLIADMDNQSTKGRGQDARKSTPRTSFTLPNTSHSISSGLIGHQQQSSSSQKQLQLHLQPTEYHSHHNGKPGSASAVVLPQQVQVLYTAMIRYRENADLRYQLLELRHLDLSRSFLELESRYRLLENERDALKQSCQVLEQVAMDVSTNNNHHSNRRGGGGVMGDMSHRSHNSHTSINSNDGRLPTRKGGASALAGARAQGGGGAGGGPGLGRFKNSTVPILQQELKMLSSQRNQLLQANLELRKQLKQMQIQMQTPKAGEDSATATCRRCHPELLAGRQQFAEDAFGNIVEEFHNSAASFSDLNRNNDNKKNSSHHRRGSVDQQHFSEAEESKDTYDATSGEEEEESTTVSYADSFDPLDGSSKEDLFQKYHQPQRQQQQQHSDLLGKRLAGGGGDGPKARPLPAPPQQQKSIVWSPPPERPTNQSPVRPLGSSIHEANQKKNAAAAADSTAAANNNNNGGGGGMMMMTPPGNSRKNNSVQMAQPTMNSILPMPLTNSTTPSPPNKKEKVKAQQLVQDIQVSPRADRPSAGDMLSESIREYSESIREYSRRGVHSKRKKSRPLPASFIAEATASVPPNMMSPMNIITPPSSHSHQQQPQSLLQPRSSSITSESSSASSLLSNNNNNNNSNNNTHSNSATTNNNTNSNKVLAPKREMEDYGMLDEFGRTKSYRNTKRNSGTSNGGAGATAPGNSIRSSRSTGAASSAVGASIRSSRSTGGKSVSSTTKNSNGIGRSERGSTHSGTTVTTSNTTNTTVTAKSMSRFRRVESAADPSSTSSSAASGNQQQPRRANSGQQQHRHSVSTVASAAPNARHLEYHTAPSEQQNHHYHQQSPQKQSPRLMNIRHLEFNHGSPRKQQQALPPPPYGSGGGEQQQYHARSERRHTVAQAPAKGSGRSLGKQQQHARGKKSEEQKAERAPRAKSYFERIKKTLQQEI